MSTRVLIVDDSRIARIMVRRIVEGIIPKCEITEAGTGDAAVAAARSDTFDLALVDYNMPGRDGLSAAAELIRMNPKLKVMLLTANVQEPLRRKAAELGLGFIGKPPTEEKLKDFLELKK